MTETACPFCQVSSNRLFHVGNHVLGLWDAFPASPGHALLVTRRHVSDWFLATQDERVELTEAISVVRAAIEVRHQPTGFNIGINCGPSAGQTIPHLHVHVIPRYAEDVDDPRGGVRNVISSLGNYLSKTPPAPLQLHNGHPDQLLVPGGADPLRPHLIDLLDKAVRADIAVAFILESGVRALRVQLVDLLERGGRLRLLAGDYLGVTDPNALLQLIDLEGNAELRIFESSRRSFHPKAYIFYDGNGLGTAFVGSSNMTETALGNGVEWNYRVISSRDERGFGHVAEAFEELFTGPATQPLTPDWIESYRDRRKVVPIHPVEVAEEAPRPPAEPHDVQLEALEALEATRDEGNSAGLVVLATGLGKTWLSAFDSHRPEYRRILFVAHREEILSQARATFRRIRPEARLGHYMGQNREPDADVLFASIQTLGRANHLRAFGPKDFDYIVVDEFHHASAATYRRLIEYFRPKFLLGLTATPERTDGGDLLALCGENLVYRVDFAEGIERELLSPFSYFGVPDEVDYSNIPWRSSRFDEEELTNALATQDRARNALDQYRLRAGKRTLAFCCSRRHADFMESFFREAGLRAVAVHSGQTTAPRATSLEMLADGKLDIVFAVDMFNEGIDIPNIDTVMMLRPTESRILWLQQFGRGLRKVDGKERLTVVDYIGNHRTFLLKPQTLLGLAYPTDAALSQALDLVAAGRFALPPGCEVTYDLRAVDILRGLLRLKKEAAEVLRLFYEDFQQREGVRPTASEALHAGFSPRAAREGYGSWLRFVDHLNGLTVDQQAVREKFTAFLDALETTPMTKSYKALVLQAMLNLGGFPGSVRIDDLAAEFAALARRSAALRQDVGSALDDNSRLRQLLENNPIKAWTDGKGMASVGYFSYEAGIFAFTPQVSEDEKVNLQEFVREIADWGLSEYLLRVPEAGRILCRVSQGAGGIPMLFLPNGPKRASLPQGRHALVAEGKPYQADFTKIGLSVLRQPDSDHNELPALLGKWFGPDAGKSGTAHMVVFDRDESGYSIAPQKVAATSGLAEPGRSYIREAIPGLYGFEFNTGSWHQGLVAKPGHVFLLVTLKKAALPEAARYRDKFLDPDVFQWESPRSTTQESKAGRGLRNHATNGVAVHLFVRASRLGSGGAAPFVYCGDTEFVDWEGEKPITIRWRLKSPISKPLFELFEKSVPL